MKVAIAHDHLNQIGGAEMVLNEFHKLYPEAPVYTLMYDPAALGAFTRGWKVRTSFLQRLPGGVRHFKWYVWLMPVAVEQLDFSGYDVVVTTTSALMKGVVVKPETLNVCYCQTPTRYLWSDTHQYTSDLPQPRLVKAVLPLVLTRLRAWDYLAAQRVDHFAANSRFVAERIRKYYRRDATVVYPPVDTAAFAGRAEPEDYYFIISRLRPYKRIDLAIRAFNKLGMKLKIAGSGEQEAELKRLARPNIEFLGQVGDAERVRLMQRCRAFIFPQEEDFGITAVEALAAGRPVIAYASGGALEIIQDGVHGKLFREQSWEALADAVIRFRYETYTAEVLQHRANEFSQQKFAERWQVFLDKALKQGVGHARSR